MGGYTQSLRGNGLFANYQDPTTHLVPKVNVPTPDKMEAGYLAQNSSRSSTFWEAWMLNEDPSVVGNNPLNIMTGGSNLPPEIRQTITGQQSNGAYNFDTPQDGAIATVYWLQHEGYSDVLNAPTDAAAIDNIAKKHGAGYFMGATNQSQADQYARHIATVYNGIDPSQNILSNVTTGDSKLKYSGLAGVFEYVDKAENPSGVVSDTANFLTGGGLKIIHRLPITILGLGIILFVVASATFKVAKPFTPIAETLL